MEAVSLLDLEAWASQRMPHNLWDFVAGGSMDEVTLRRNRSAFQEITIRPRYLVDVSNRDMSTTVLGHRISIPIMTAPAGAQRMAHPDGEVAVARAAGSMGTLMALATSSGYSIEEVAEAASGPLWFQLYHFDDDVTTELVTRAKKAGYSAIILTVDTPLTSPKDRDARNGFVRIEGQVWGSLKSRPDLMERVRIPDTPERAHRRERVLDWRRLDWLRSLTGLPLIIKGILSVEDALLCAQHGVDAIIVSNHGGRTMDSLPATIEVLPDIVDAVGDKLEVYLDSGVRRGTDALKALALGARAVLVGRPVLWGLAVDGEAGVRRALEILRDEFERAMAFCGYTRAKDIGPSAVSLPCRCPGHQRSAAATEMDARR